MAILLPRAPGEKLISLTMLGWALNEEENIAESIERAEKLRVSLAPDFELVLIDDGSTDRTAVIVETHQRIRPWLRLHRNGHNRARVTTPRSPSRSPVRTRIVVMQRKLDSEWSGSYIALV